MEYHISQTDNFLHAQLSENEKDILLYVSQNAGLVTTLPFFQDEENQTVHFLATSSLFITYYPIPLLTGEYLLHPIYPHPIAIHNLWVFMETGKTD